MPEVLSHYIEYLDAQEKKEGTKEDVK